jgi:hypothetical protein
VTAKPFQIVFFWRYSKSYICANLWSDGRGIFKGLAALNLMRLWAYLIMLRSMGAAFCFVIYNSQCLPTFGRFGDNKRANRDSAKIHCSDSGLTVRANLSCNLTK